MANWVCNVTTPLPVAVFGGGLVGVRHARALTDCPLTKLTTVVEPDPKTRARLESLGYPVVSTLQAVPAKTRAAIVSTPTPLHREHTLFCLDRHWPVIVEKPITGTLNEGRSLIAAAQGKTFYVGHHRRCHPFIDAARNRLGDLGDPVAVQAFWSLRKDTPYFDMAWRRGPGGGPILINLIHDIDLLQVILGPIAEVTALVSNARRGFEISDSAALALRFDNGVVGTVILSDAGASPWSFEAATGENPNIAYSGMDYLRISATKGAISLPSGRVWTGAETEAPTWGDRLRLTPGQPQLSVDPLLDQVARFATEISGGPASGLCSANEGLSALEITLACAYSGQTGRPVRRGTVPGDYDGTTHDQEAHT